MTPLLEQFLSETREVLQAIAANVMQLEARSDEPELMASLFRLVHTLKGNSGLFEFGEMTRVLHAGEDLMDAVRHARVAYSKDVADRLLDAMDFVATLCDGIEVTGVIAASYALESARLAEALRQLCAPIESPISASVTAPRAAATAALEAISETSRMAAYRRGCTGDELFWVEYVPVADCFFQGDDPFFQARRTPALLWGEIGASRPWAALGSLDAYQCALQFTLLSAGSRATLDEHFRYVPDQVRVVAVAPSALVFPSGPPGSFDDSALVTSTVAALKAGELSLVRTAVATMLERVPSGTRQRSALAWLALVLELCPTDHVTAALLLDSLRAPSSNTDATLVSELVAVQREILSLPIDQPWHVGRIAGVVSTLRNLLSDSLVGFEDAATVAIASARGEPLLAWLDTIAAPVPEAEPSAPIVEPIKPVRASDDAFVAPKTVKVDQAKVDRLMNLIGEMLVSKNALSYLAGRAESVFGARELSREIKAQHAVINRIAEEMQDVIMQVRMMPVSFVFQRFPRLVRDLSRKLGKEVNLVLEGDETEADKSVIEALADPLVHLVRNSLDHGLELPSVRVAAGKPATGTITIRARQDADRVVIELRDDGRGIDPVVIRRKAYEKGLIDEAELDRLSDADVINLIFTPGFSTTETVSDLSGRGVGMDVVRTAVAKVNGTVTVDSSVGIGTTIRLSLPLSMAITNVMIVEADGQAFGIPMDTVVETVRVPRADVRSIKHSMTTVLRGRVVALKSLNQLLGWTVEPRRNANDELAILVVRHGEEWVGLVVDDFRATVDIILKPMVGVLSMLSAYAGSALLGDGSVLMVLDTKELL